MFEVFQQQKMLSTIAFAAFFQLFVYFEHHPLHDDACDQRREPRKLRLPRISTLPRHRPHLGSQHGHKRERYCRLRVPLPQFHDVRCHLHHEEIF